MLVTRKQHDEEEVNQCVCVCDEQIHTHSGAAVYEGACDLQHVCVLFELQEVPLQLLLVSSHLAELHLQPLKLLLNVTTQ